MYNKVIIMGRITNDLELKTTPQGASVLAFSVAVDRRYQTKGEEKKTDFFNVVAWRNEAEFISRYFSKGRMILIEGELQTRAYTDKNNNTVRVTEIVADRATFTGEKKPDGVTADASSSQMPPTVSAGQPDVAEMVVSASDEDYPF